MNKKMSFFRFCRRSLTALPVFLVFISCDKLLPTSGNGVDIPVKIRAVNVAGGSQTEITTRASGESKRRIIGEPIVQDLGDGTLAEITVEEDVSALRDATLLASGKKFRVIAIDATTKKLYSYADYTVPSTAPQNGEISPYAGELHVLDGNNYDFICISYNSATDLPDNKDYEEGEELPLLSASVSQDIFYWRQEAQPVGSNLSLGIVLRPQFVKVKLKLDGNGMTITNIADNSISLNVATSGSFNLAKGEFSSSGSINFTGLPTGTMSKTDVESSQITFLPKAADDYIISLAAGALTLLFDILPQESSAAKTASILNSKLAVGGSYTIQLKLIPYNIVGYFAGELAKNTNNVWKFTKKLYAQSADASTSIQWATASKEQGVTDDTQGKANTYNLATSTSYTNPAATLCFQKNTDYANISATSDANYIWYLPAHKQLMAIWAVHDSFVDAAKFSTAYYWSSTEDDYVTSMTVNFAYGTTGRTPKTSASSSHRARCVREV